MFYTSLQDKAIQYVAPYMRGESAASAQYYVLRDQSIVRARR